MAWVGAACQQVRRLVPRLWHECGLRVSPRTLKRALRRAGYGWKRTRRSLKNQRDPAAFAACRQQLASLHRAEQAGQLAQGQAPAVAEHGLRPLAFPRMRPPRGAPLAATRSNACASAAVKIIGASFMPESTA